MSERQLGPDVVRAVALIGVVTMNYHGFLNGSAAQAESSSPFLERLFDPWGGILATRFAATFVLVAGVGASLMTDRARRSNDPTAWSDVRWRLARRGLAIGVGGFLLEYAWPGTILFYYGVYFVLAAFLVGLSSRWVAVTGGTAALAAAIVALWRAWREHQGHDTGWLEPADLDSFQNLTVRVFLAYTHPVLPWFAFFCAGLLLGRALPRLHQMRGRLLALGAGLLAGSYMISAATARTLADPAPGGGFWPERGGQALTSTAPASRTLLYAAGTLGSALVAYVVISWWASRRPSAPAPAALARAGQMALSIYLLHVVVFYVLVDWTGMVGGGSLTNALLLSGLFWVLAVTAASWWRRVIGLGPAEWLYRRLGG